MGSVPIPDTSRAPVVYTVGHAAHATDEFVALLRGHGIRVLVDVRRAPGSRHAPQFNAGALAASLERNAIAYVHIRELGGWRKTGAGSPNGAWTNRAFRGYADHMASQEFEDGLARLLAASRDGPTACMCAESLWWRCHRRLLADALVVRGHTVMHILPDGHAQDHALTPGAQVDGVAITYPPPQASLGI
jgi:uncharacterized protein (DUF488 family)